MLEKRRILGYGISNFDSINPLISNNREILNFDKLIFEPLLNLTPDYKLEQCLATEVSRISDTSYVVKINNDIKWHDGSYLIAKDVQFTIDRLKEGRSIYAYNVEKVVGLEVIDASTIKINLSEPVPFFEYNLTFPILPNNYYLGEDFYESGKIPIGTGQYKIASIDGGNIILGKNDKWWNIKNKDAKLEAITIKIFSEMGEVYNSFKLGNIDAISTVNNQIQNYIGTIGYTRNDYKGRNFTYLAFNCQDDILCNTEVRKAIGYSIDKTNILSTIYGNDGYISCYPLDYGNSLYTDGIVNSDYNQDQAKIILMQGGWEYKTNKWQMTDENYKTKKIEITLTVNRDDPLRVAVAENIQSQLAQVGMIINIRGVSSNQYEDIINSKNYEMILTGIYNSYSPSLETFFGNDNLQNFENDELNNLLNEVKNTSDENKLREDYNKIEEIYSNELPFLSLYRDKATLIKNQNIYGEITPNNYFTYYNIHTWSRF